MATLPAGSANLDMAVTKDSAYLYTLDAGTGVVSILQIAGDGTLKLVGEKTGFAPGAGANGLAAF